MELKTFMSHGLQYIVDWDEQGNVNIYIKTPDQVIKSLDLEAAVRVQIIETKFKLWYFELEKRALN